MEEVEQPGAMESKPLFCMLAPQEKGKGAFLDLVRHKPVPCLEATSGEHAASSIPASFIRRGAASLQQPLANEATLYNRGQESETALKVWDFHVNVVKGGAEKSSKQKETFSRF